MPACRRQKHELTFDNAMPGVMSFCNCWITADMGTVLPSSRPRKAQFLKPLQVRLLLLEFTLHIGNRGEPVGDKCGLLIGCGHLSFYRPTSHRPSRPPSAPSRRCARWPSFEAGLRTTSFTAISGSRRPRAVRSPRMRSRWSRATIRTANGTRTISAFSSCTWPTAGWNSRYRGHRPGAAGNGLVGLPAATDPSRGGGAQRRCDDPRIRSTRRLRDARRRSARAGTGRRKIACSNSSARRPAHMRERCGLRSRRRAFPSSS